MVFPGFFLWNTLPNLNFLPPAKKRQRSGAVAGAFIPAAMQACLFCGKRSNM